VFVVMTASGAERFKVGGFTRSNISRQSQPVAGKKKASCTVDRFTHPACLVDPDENSQSGTPMMTEHSNSIMGVTWRLPSPTHEVQLRRLDTWRKKNRQAEWAVYYHPACRKYSKAF
jgi:hypothetical protein